jgi:hypothetical protein
MRDSRRCGIDSRFNLGLVDDDVPGFGLDRLAFSGRRLGRRHPRPGLDGDARLRPVRRFPLRGLGADLRFAENSQVLGDGFFVVESEMPGVGPNESFVEHSSGKLIEAFHLDGFKHPRVDLGDARNVIKR